MLKLENICVRWTKISLEEMIENVTVILSEEHEAEDWVLFPSEEEIMDILQNPQ